MTEKYKVFDLNSDHEIIIESNKILNKIVNNKSSKKTNLKKILGLFQQKNYWEIIDIPDINNDIKKIFGQFLINNGFELKEDYSKYLAEIHLSKADETPLEPKFCWHFDDNGGIDCKVNTLIVYLEKTANGGNFEIKQENSTNITIETLKNRCILLSGDIEHRPLAINDGIRHTFVIQFERKN